MQFITNATFLINIAKTDIGIVKEFEFVTIDDVLNETLNEIGIKLERQINIKTGVGKDAKKKINIDTAKVKSLSLTDIKLLNIAYTKKRSCILISDDRVVRAVAKKNKITCYTTAQFIAYMVKTGQLSKNEGLLFLNDLKEIYIRPRDIEKVMNRIKKWR